ncbi:MAG: ATP-binding protein [Spirochaetaceae bacterium]|nr:ATP-binding protein [Spirochaetaceae bacterium]
MISEEQIKGLIQAHNDKNEEKFKSIVLKLAEDEAIVDQLAFSQELKNLAESNRKTPTVLLNQIQKSHIITKYEPEDNLSDLIVSTDIHDRIRRLLNEYRNSQKFKAYGRSSRRKILFEGNKGTGKTYTASVIASELNLPLYVVQMDKMVLKYMGETSSKLRNLFNSINTSKGVYLFDELDRFFIIDKNFLTAFLQFIEQDFSNSIIIIITNNKNLIANSSLKTFDDVLYFNMPSQEEIEHIYKSKLSHFQEDFVASSQLIFQSQRLSHSEIVKVCDEIIKETILPGSKLSQARILSLVKEKASLF